MTVSHRPAAAAFALAALCVLGVIVLTALHTPAPELLSQLAVLAAGGALGVSVPFTGSTGSAVVETADNVTVTASTPAADVPILPAYTAPAGS